MIYSLSNKIKAKPNNRAKTKFALKFISVRSNPWRVAITFQIELINVRKMDEINK